jgi:predicted nuclease with TOPRIM domain
MATTAVEPRNHDQSGSDDIQAAAFQALEQRVLRAIELLRTERELRTAAEQRLHQAEEQGLEIQVRLEEQTAQLTAQLAEKNAESSSHAARVQQQAEQIRRLEGEMSQLQGERDQVRQRVEKLLQHLDEFTGV